MLIFRTQHLLLDQLSGGRRWTPDPTRRHRLARRSTAALLCCAAAGLFVAAAPLQRATARSGAAFPGTNGLIAFGRETPAGNHTQTDVLTVSPDGTTIVRLTTTPRMNEFGPAWDAAGGRLAFWRTRAPFGPGSLWLMNADGSGKRRLTVGIDARDPAWNPTGNRLVYSRAAGDLFTLRTSDGLGRRQLTSGPALDFEPAWSPDGTRIAFTRGLARGDVGDIYVMTRATGAMVRITHSRAYDHQVAWAPGGHRLVFERDFAARSSVYSVRPDGSDLQRLTADPHFDTAPAYSPDGSRIVFGSDRRGAGSDLWVMRRDGHNAHRLLHMTFFEGSPDWQPIPP